MLTAAADMWIQRDATEAVARASTALSPLPDGHRMYNVLYLESAAAKLLDRLVDDPECLGALATHAGAGLSSEYYLIAAQHDPAWWEHVKPKPDRNFKAKYSRHFTAEDDLLLFNENQQDVVQPTVSMRLRPSRVPNRSEVESEGGALQTAGAVESGAGAVPCTRMLAFVHKVEKQLVLPTSMWLRAVAFCFGELFRLAANNVGAGGTLGGSWQQGVRQQVSFLPRIQPDSA